MRVHEISFYNDFNCIMGECPNTCCQNWVIIVDNETYGNYINEPGIKGIKLRRGIEKHGELVTIKKKHGVCPFLSEEGKCSLQISDGDKFMPEVCIVFPRHRVNFGAFSEEIFFLSCPETARLLFENRNNFHLTTTEKDVEYEKWVTNEDENYLNELLNIRESLAEVIIDKNIDRALIYGSLVNYAKDLQISYAEGTRENKEFDLNQYINKQTEFSISFEYIDKMITSALYHKQLKKTGPLLYELFNMYFKQFDNLTALEANRYFDKVSRKMREASKEADEVIRAYFKYYLYCEFLYTYEDYSFLKYIILGISHVTMLELLFSLYYLKYGKLDKEDIVNIICSYDRRGRHNDSTSECIYKALEPLMTEMFK